MAESTPFVLFILQKHNVLFLLSVYTNKSRPFLDSIDCSLICI